MKVWKFEFDITKLLVGLVAIAVVLAVVFTILNTSGCGGGSSPQDKFANAILSGQVTEVGSGNAIAGAKVNLSFARETKTVTTSADGKYSATITNLQVGSSVDVAVTASKDGYKPTTKHVALGGKESKVLDFQLETSTIPAASLKGRITDEQSQAIANATVKLTVNIGGLDLVVSTKSQTDGRYSLNVSISSASTAHVAVSADGYVSRSEDVSMTVGATATLDVSLTLVAPVTGTLKVTSTPFGCAVTVNGTNAGTTPLTIDKPASNYTVACSKANFDGQQKNVTVIANATTDVHFWLKLKPGVEQTGSWRLEDTGKAYVYDSDPYPGDYVDVAIANDGYRYLSAGISGFVKQYKPDGSYANSSQAWEQIRGIATDLQGNIWVAVNSDNLIVQLNKSLNIVSQTPVDGNPFTVRYADNNLIAFTTGGKVGFISKNNGQPQVVSCQGKPASDSSNAIWDPDRDVGWLIDLGQWGKPGLLETNFWTGEGGQYVPLPGFQGFGGYKIPGKDLFLVTSAAGNKIILINSAGTLLSETSQYVPTGITQDPSNGEIHVCSRVVRNYDTDPYVRIYRLVPN